MENLYIVVSILLAFWNSIAANTHQVCKQNLSPSANIYSTKLYSCGNSNPMSLWWLSSPDFACPILSVAATITIPATVLTNQQLATFLYRQGCKTLASQSNVNCICINQHILTNTSSKSQFKKVTVSQHATREAMRTYFLPLHGVFYPQLLVSILPSAGEDYRIPKQNANTNAKKTE